MFKYFENVKALNKTFKIMYLVMAIVVAVIGNFRLLKYVDKVYFDLLHQGFFWALFIIVFLTITAIAMRVEHVRLHNGILIGLLCCLTIIGFIGLKKYWIALSIVYVLVTVAFIGIGLHKKKNV